MEKMEWPSKGWFTRCILIIAYLFLNVWKHVKESYEFIISAISLLVHYYVTLQTHIGKGINLTLYTSKIIVGAL